MDKLEIICAVLVMGLVTIIGGDAPGELHEFCQNENFQASCGSDDVILMEEARYGRMRLTRCVRKDYGYIGCQKDVLDIVDTQCSGRHGCSIRVPNEMLDAAETDCPEDFKKYFEASYSCVKVATPMHGACLEGNRVALTEPQGTIASVVTLETKCGSAHSPWVIQVKPGQQIQVTLIDFAYGSPDNVADHTKCYAYASMKELNSKRSITVCGGRMRESVVFTSLANKVQVIVFGSGTDNNARHFLLQYQAVGCADPSDIKNGWFKREGDSIIVGCNDSTESMTAVCNGTMWDRHLTNCSSHGASSAVVKAPFRFSMSYEIAIVIILAIALIIASIILCVGVVCMRNRIRDQRSQQVQQHYLYSDRAQQYMAAHTAQSPIRKDIYPPCQASYEQYRGGENLYASIQDNFPANLCPLDGKQHSDMCTCRIDVTSRDGMRGTGNGPYSSLEQPVGVPSAHPEPISPTSQSDLSISYPETGRPYYVLDSRDTDYE